MKFNFHILAAAVTLATPSRAVFKPGSTTKVEPQPSLGFIIELEPSSSINGRGVGGASIDAHSAFHRRAQDVVDYSVRHEFKNPEYFYGLSIDAKNETNIATLLSLPQVKQVWPNRYYERPTPVVSGRATKVPNGFTPVRPQPIYLRDAAEVATINGTSDVLSSLKMTGVDQVHALGLTGKGIKVGVLDTGVDWRHPALGGGYGEGFKVAGGYDLVGDDFVGWNDPVPDDNPLTTCLEGGHGTHVAGIIAARDPEGVGFGLVGVAPDATLHAYRVLGCSGGTTDDILMQGFEKAASDGVDVISMSIGETAVWETGSPYVPLLAKIQSQGIGLVVAAGNEGDQGLYVSSAPAQDPSVISVGSVSDVSFATVYNAAGSDGSTVQYARVVPLDTSANFHVFVADDDDANCLDQAWDDAMARFPDKQNVIALVSAGSSCLLDIDVRSDASGFKNVWEWIPDSSDMEIDEPGANGDVDLVRLKKSESKKILEGIAKMGENFTLGFEDQAVYQIEQPTGNTTSWFSTFGPTMEMSLKPQVSAPGGTILSTWVTSNGWGYAIISGTSMATPHIAGCYALVKQKYPNLGPKEIARRLQSSATPLELYQGNGILTTAAQQGAGLVNIFKAVTADSVFSATEFNLRDTPSPSKQSFTIENQSPKAKTYTIGHRGAAQVDALPQVKGADVNEMFYWALNFNAVYADVSFEAQSITVPAGGKATVDFTITPPSSVDPSLLPTYSGFITVAEGENEFVIPYLGVPYARAALSNIYTGDVKNISLEPKPLAGVPTLPFISASDSGVRNDDRMVFNFPAKEAPEGQTRPADNNPVITLFVDQPSAYVRLDAVPVDLASNAAFNFTPSILGYIPSESLNSTSYANTTMIRPPLDLDSLDNFAGVKSYGLIGSMYGGDMPKYVTSVLFRGYSVYGTEWTWAEVELANGTLYQLPNADYRVLIRALRWGKDLNDPSGYDSWLSPIVRVNVTDPGYPNPWSSI